MAKYKRHYVLEPLQRGLNKITGCNSFSIYNAGNTVCTVNRILPLEPMALLEGAECHPDIEEEADIYIEFNDALDVAAADILTPTGGTFGNAGSDSNPTAIKDSRVIIIKTVLVPA